MTSNFSLLCSSCGCRLAVPSATVAVNPSAPTYENVIIVFLICVTLIILALIIKGVHASCSKSKPSGEVTEDPVWGIYKKVYVPILDKKFDYLKKMADKELEKGGTEQSREYLAALDEQLMKWAPKVFGEEGEPVSKDTHE